MDNGTMNALTIKAFEDAKDKFEHYATSSIYSVEEVIFYMNAYIEDLSEMLKFYKKEGE